MTDGIELPNRADMAPGVTEVCPSPAPPTCANPFADSDSVLGKPSKIHKYCITPERQDKTCIWLCRKQGRRAVAWDRPDEDPEKGSGGTFRLLGSNPWWNRFAFYNCVGVRHAQIKFLGPPDKNGRFSVVLRNFNHSEAVVNMRHELDSIEMPDPNGCGVDKIGKRQCLGDYCSNQVADEEGNPYCSASNYARLNRKMQKWVWMPQMLDYFWKNGVEHDGFNFLKESGFVWSYSALAYDSWHDAEDLYGKTVDALELVSGWRIRRILWTTLAAIVLDIFIVAIVTLLTGSGETGLAAGSYAAAIEALLMALLTLLGAIVQQS